MFGELVQTVKVGEDCTQVYAVADAGYRFTGWSDGVGTSQRIDMEVEGSRIITAQFEQIMVLCYSDNLLVRQYTLNEFKTLDITKIVGYASSKIFEGWEFLGAYSGYTCESPLELIKTCFVVMSNISDISLNAKYSEITEIENVPLSSKTIAHGLGGLSNTAYINSKESFEYYYGLGQRFFEADICFTIDKKPIVSHFNFNYYYDSFMSTATDGYTPLDLAGLLNLISLYSDVMVDLDVLGIYYGPHGTPDANYEAFFKEFHATIEEVDSTWNLYNRLILEILPNDKTNMFELAKEFCEFSKFLYAEYYDSTLPISDNSIDEICQWCKESGVLYLSIGNIKKEWVDIMHSYGIYIMVFTYNDPITMYNYYDIGVDCIFTDFIFI